LGWVASVVIGLGPAAAAAAAVAAAAVALLHLLLTHADMAARHYWTGLLQDSGSWANGREAGGTAGLSCCPG